MCTDFLTTYDCGCTVTEEVNCEPRCRHRLQELKRPQRGNAIVARKDESEKQAGIDRKISEEIQEKKREKLQKRGKKERAERAEKRAANKGGP